MGEMDDVAREAYFMRVLGTANYKRASYPLRLDKKESSPKGSCKSLIEICSEEIVSDARGTERAVRELPLELCYSLVKAALQTNRDEAVEVLVSSWRWSILSLRQLLPPVCPELKVLYSRLYVCKELGIYQDYTNSLVSTFLAYLEERSPVKLKYLDISGCPTAEIQLDVVLNSVETCRSLWEALRLGKLYKSHLKIRIIRLDVMFTGTAGILLLMDQLDDKDLLAVSIPHNQLGCEGLRALAPALGKLSSLTGLDLSWNDINIVDCSHSADVLGQTLAQLPVLTRLNLNKIGLTNQLDIVLSKMSASLRDLQLRYCGVSEKDITFLTNSQHASTLEALDISYNNVGNYFEEFVLLLSALKNQLVILQTVNCSFQQDHLTHLLRITSKNLCHLRLWDISHNCPPTTMDAFIQDLTALAEAVSLEKLLVSFPEELGSIDGASIVESPTGKFRQDFHETVMNRLSKLFGKASRLGVEVVMVKNSDKKFGQ